MFYILTNLPQLAWHLASTQQTTFNALMHKLGSQQILRERIFQKLVDTFSQTVTQFAPVDGDPASLGYEIQNLVSFVPLFRINNLQTC